MVIVEPGGWVGGGCRRSLCGSGCVRFRRSIFQAFGLFFGQSVCLLTTTVIGFLEEIG